MSDPTLVRGYTGPLSGNAQLAAPVLVSLTLWTLDTADPCKCLKAQQAEASQSLARQLLRLQSGSDMLKISIIENETRIRLTLEGKLVAPWTGELKNVCRDNESELKHRELVIDVRGLTVISKEGEDVLLALMIQGAKFRGRGVFTKQILKQLARRAYPHRSEGKTWQE